MAFRVGLLGRDVSVVKIGKKSIKSTLMWPWDPLSVWVDEKHKVYLPGEQVAGTWRLYWGPAGSWEQKWNRERVQTKVTRCSHSHCQAPAHRVAFRASQERLEALAMMVSGTGRC